MANFFKGIALIAILTLSANCATYNYPVKSINLASALNAEFYSGMNSDSAGLSPVSDIQAVHGIQTSDGGYVVVGKGMESEGSSNEEAFAIKFTSSGAKSWSWRSNHAGKDVANAVGQSGLHLFVVGYRVVGGVAKRSLTKLSESTGVEGWTTTDFGDTKNGAFEMITVGSDSNVYMTGVTGKTNLEEMNFKSYGNVPDGSAVVVKMTQSTLTGSAIPSLSSITWTKIIQTHVTAKAVEMVGSSSIAVLLWGEEALQAGLIKLSTSDGSTQWGPTNFGTTHGEGTDIAVSTDGSTIAISGQGGSSSPKTILGRLTLVTASSGSIISTTSFGSGGNDNIIFNECWGVQAMPNNGGYALSCGTGIEGGHCAELSGTEKTNCNSGVGDSRTGAVPRKENIWQSLTVRTDASGTVQWQRVDSYRDPNQPASTSDASYVAASSAAEWIILSSNGDLAIVTDEVFGLGLLKLGTGAAGSSDSTSSVTSSGIIISSNFVFIFLVIMTLIAY